MTRSIKQLFIVTASIYSVYFLYLSLAQEVQADTGAELRNRGQQCRGWVEAGDLRRDQASNCLAACERYGNSVEKHPEILSDEGVRSCNEAYSWTKRKVAGMQKPKEPTAQAPDNFEEMTEEANKAIKEWKLIVDNATASELKRQAEVCHGACERSVTFISREKHRNNIKRAQTYWRSCTECKAYDAHANIVSVSKTISQVEPSPDKAKTTMSSMPDVEGVYLQAMQGRLRVRAESRDDWNTICVGFARIKDRNDDYARKLKGHDRVRLIGITYNPDEASGPRGKCSAERIVILGPSQ